MGIQLITISSIIIILFIGIFAEYRINNEKTKVERLVNEMLKLEESMTKVSDSARGLANDYYIVVDILYDELGKERAEKEFQIRKHALSSLGKKSYYEYKD